jgi:hypothetical protein
MAVAVFMHFPGLSQAQYDALMGDLDLDADPAWGEILHVAAEAPNGINVCDLWQTREAAESFVDERLQPALDFRKFKVQVRIEFLPLRNVFAPDLDMIERIGAVSLPGHDPGAALRRATNRERRP